jgi:hypothetical protein
MAKGRLTGFSAEPQADGSFNILVQTETQTEVEVTVPPDDWKAMVRHFQEAAIQRFGKSPEPANMSFPELRLVDVNLGHQGNAAELMASTDQVGAVMLLATNEVLQKLRSEIDRVLAYRSTATTAH